MAQHAGGGQRRLPGPEHRDRQARAQCIKAGITDRIDTHGGIAFFLGLEARLKHTHVHQHGVVVAVAQCCSPADRDKLHRVALANAVSRQL